MQPASCAGARRRFAHLGAFTFVVALACALEPTQFVGTLIAVFSGVVGLLATLVLVGLRSAFAVSRGWARAFHPHAPEARQLWGQALAAALCALLIAPGTFAVQRVTRHRAERWLESLAQRVDEQVERTGAPPADLEELTHSEWSTPWLARVGRIEYRPHADGSYSFEISKGLWSSWSWHSATRRWAHYD